MSYVLPTIADFKTQFVRDFPYATPLSATAAQAVASIGSGQFVTDITVTSPGSAYGANPATFPVILYGGGGIGAQAVATAAGGIVTGIVIVSAGIGYTTAPNVYVPQGGDNTKEDKVTDFDIANAFVAMAVNLTQRLFSSQAAFTRCYNLLAAHYLCESMIASGVGLGGQAQWLTNAKTVGNVTESFSIPDRVLKSPILAKLSKTTYGAQFLELMSPQLIGNFSFSHRATLP